MSLEKFITDMLNVELDELDSITSIPQSDDSIVIKLKLCKKENVSCLDSNRKQYQILLLSAAFRSVDIYGQEGPHRNALHSAYNPPNQSHNNDIPDSNNVPRVDLPL